MIVEGLVAVVGILLYALIALGIGAMIYALVDPYNHGDTTKLKRWTQAILGGAFWPLLLVYIFGCYVYYTYIKGGKNGN